MATDRWAFKTYGASGPGWMLDRFSVCTKTSNSAGSAKGFMTTTYAVRPSVVSSSGRYQVRRDEPTHRSAAVPSGDVECSTTAAPTHPPKNSTCVAAPASVALISRNTSRPAGPERPGPEPSVERESRRRHDDGGSGHGDQTNLQPPRPRAQPASAAGRGLRLDPLGFARLRFVSHEVGPSWSCGESSTGPTP